MNNFFPRDLHQGIKEFSKFGGPQLLPVKLCPNSPSHEAAKQLCDLSGSCDTKLQT